MWSWGWPTYAQKQTKNVFFVFSGCFWAYVGQPHDHISWVTLMPFNESAIPRRMVCVIFFLYTIHFFMVNTSFNRFNISSRNWTVANLTNQPNLWFSELITSLAEIAKLYTTLTLSTDSSSSIGTISSFFTQPWSQKERKLNVVCKIQTVLFMYWKPWRGSTLSKASQSKRQDLPKQ